MWLLVDCFLLEKTIEICLDTRNYLNQREKTDFSDGVSFFYLWEDFCNSHCGLNECESWRSGLEWNRFFFSCKMWGFSLYFEDYGGDFGFDERNPYLVIAIARWLTEPKTNQTKNANAWKSLLKRAELVKAYA